MSVYEYALLQSKISKLKRENAYLRKLLGIKPKKQITLPISDLSNTSVVNQFSEKSSRKSNYTMTSKEKIELLKKRFRGRNEVYALRWENKAGRSGYSPVCTNEWVKPICQKPQIRCGKCKHRSLAPMTDQVIYQHLVGEKFIGIYPLLQDDSCNFVAVDFDKETWMNDVIAFFNICKKNNVSALIERSQSGNGAHVWIFFAEPVSARMARNLGTGLLTLTMRENPELSMDSYDRLFPNQDTLPKGGYGNLIALPLQGARRKENNSVFVDESLQAYTDQWLVLESVKSLSLREVNNFVDKMLSDGLLLDTYSYEDNIDVSTLPWENVNQQVENLAPKMSNLPKCISIVLANLIYIEIKDIPKTLVNQLKRLSSFQNPEFYRAQSMRLSTYGKPRIISCSEIFKNHIGLPRGCLDNVKELLENYGISINFGEKTNLGEPVNYTFHYQLHEVQKKAFKSIIGYRYSVLAATTAFGKTVLAGKVIADRRINTLVLVHRRQLLEQWQEKLSTMFNVNLNEIGVLMGGKNKLTGKVDIAMLQSLLVKGEVNPLILEYGQIIVDECHHVSAFSFEQVLKMAKPRFVLGLTATPKRKDGHHPIVTMQCGPIRYFFSNKEQVKITNYQYTVFVKKTTFDMSIVNLQHTMINEIYTSLSKNELRNQMIFNDVLSSIEKGRKPLLLTERTEHLRYFERKFQKFVKNVVSLHGGMTTNKRKEQMTRLASFTTNDEWLIIATGKYIGEGFDESRLDTLFIALPISWQGTLQQYVGRLHRQHQDKYEIQVYDYVDTNISMLNRMYQKRLKKYIAMGYSIINK